MRRFVRSPSFWLGFVIAITITGLFFGWQADLFIGFLPSPARPPLTTEEVMLTVGMIFLFGLNAGLYLWQKREGSCPIGTKRATGLAGILGAITLVCPACTIIPITLLGTSLTLGFLTPFLPLLRFVTFLILAMVAWMLWPKKA